MDLTRHLFLSRQGSQYSDGETAQIKNKGRSLELHGTYIAFPKDFIRELRRAGTEKTYLLTARSGTLCESESSILWNSVPSGKFIANSLAWKATIS